jgi:DNA-binding FrmR family transcriptional regulator
MASMKKKDCCEKHPDHSGHLPRLARIAGQVKGIGAMIEKRAYCPDILTQLRATRAALHAMEAEMLEAHLDACVTEAFAAGDMKQKKAKITELKTLYRRYQE